MPLTVEQTIEIIDRLLVLVAQQPTAPDPIPLAQQPTTPDPFQDEREQIMKALEQANGVQTEAARLLGVYPSKLNRRMQELGIPRPKDLLQKSA